MVALVALIAAGSIGAVIRATVFPVQYKHFAYLAGTSALYCYSFNQVWTRPSLNALSFSCYYVPHGAGRLTDGYTAVINRNAVSIYHFRQGNGKAVRYFFNNPGKYPAPIAIPSGMARSAPAGG